MSRPPGLGVIAEFADADAMTEAVKAARAAGWTGLEAYAPHPVPEAAEALGVSAAPVGYIAIAAGVFGAALAYGLEWWVSVGLYPVNVGGRPPHAWPAFLPTTYLVAVLWACAAALVGMLALNGLPRLHHPVFHARGFAQASERGFFLLLSAEDPLYEREAATRFLRALSALRVSEVRAS
ncbi:DUF3341 domain-containing protein [Muricoccus radiodurans]|uniref:DUF3341 domain-containing protein n=1 Tax=Muricoccus radiodurans TaxID=2231721 RepID=UPI003CEF0617